MTDDDLPSREQQAWQRIAAAIREQFEARVPEMEAMDADDLQQFVSAVEGGMGLEVAAECHDEIVAMNRRRLFD